MRHFWWQPVLLAAVAMSAVPRTVRAAPPDANAGASSSAVDDARRRFQRGVQFYKDGDFRSALVEFEEAYRISPNYRLQYNVGQTCQELGDFASAVKAFSAYLDGGGSEIPQQRRTQVESDLKQLEQHVARLEIEASEPGAELIAEGDRKIELGLSPLSGAALLNSGAWTITARKEGFEPASEKATVAGGDRKKLTLVLKKVQQTPVVLPVVIPPPEVPKPQTLPLPAPAPIPVPAAVEPHHRSLTPVWIGLGITGALTAAAVTTGVLALNAKSDYDNKLATFGVSASDVTLADNRTKTFGLTTDVLIGCAVAGGIVTLVLYLTSSSKPGPSTGSLPINVLVLPGGLGFSGAF